jgi:pyruvate kinase
MIKKAILSRITPKNKTKIICTIGPASNSKKNISDLILNGMNIARLNFSHGLIQEHIENISKINEISKKLNMNIPILIDLPGAKIRIGKLKEDLILLSKDDVVTLTTKKVIGNKKIIPVRYKHLSKTVSKGSIVFLSDGLIELKVLDFDEENVRCKVIIGGSLVSYKGINFRDSTVHLNPVTKKDLEIVNIGIIHGVDIFCISYPKDEKDIKKIKNFAKKQGKNVKVIAKIERSEAIKNFDEILKLADGIMVARGDLGIEIPIEEIPTTQKQLIRKANIAGVPVITATQMMKSMTENPRPTRAEVTDVANAILDGTDAVMLSEETAIGKYPVQTVKTMIKIAVITENKRNDSNLLCNIHDFISKTPNEHNLRIADVISINVIEAHSILNPKYIITTTSTGTTARIISRFKPKCWILSFTKNKDTADFLNFSYGVFPIHLKHDKESWHGVVIDFIKENRLVKKGDVVFLTQRRFVERKEGTDSFGVIKI